MCSFFNGWGFVINKPARYYCLKQLILRQADLAGVGYGIFLMDLEKAKEILY